VPISLSVSRTRARCQRVGEVNGKPFPAGACLAPLATARSVAARQQGSATGSRRARVLASLAALRTVFADRALARTALLLCVAWFALSLGVWGCARVHKLAGQRARRLILLL
jgi:hypothetical protein